MTVTIYNSKDKEQRKFKKESYKLAVKVLDRVQGKNGWYANMSLPLGSFLHIMKVVIKQKKQYEKEIAEIRQNNPDYKPSFNTIKKNLCKEYAILEMKIVNETVSILLFDEDIEKLIIAIRASHKRGDNYVFANIDEFQDDRELLDFNVYQN